MLAIVRSITSPLISLVLLMLSNGFFITYISVYLNSKGYGDNIIGYVHSAYYLGWLLGALRLEKFLNRVGHIRAFAAFASLNTATVLLQGLFFHPIFWVIMRFFAGVSFASVFIVIESWFLHASTPSTRGRILSLYMICLYGSMSFGQFILDYVTIDNLTPFLAAGTIAALSVIPLATTYARSPEVHKPSVQNILEFFKISPFGSMGCVVGGVLLSSIYSFMPTFAQDHGMRVSILMSLTIAGGFLLQWPIGHLSDIFDRRLILMVLSAVIIVLAPCMMYVLDRGTLFLFLAFLLGGACFTVYPLSITYVCDKIMPEEIASATGMLMGIYGAGAVLGPLLAAGFIRQSTSLSLFPFMAISSGVLLCIGLYSVVMRAVVPLEDQKEFIAMPPSTPVAMELDPRTEEEE